MAIRVELNRDQMKETIETKIASIKRAQNSSKNPRLQEIYTDDLKQYQNALNTLSEIK